MGESRLLKTLNDARVLSRVLTETHNWIILVKERYMMSYSPDNQTIRISYEWEAYDEDDDPVDRLFDWEWIDIWTLQLRLRHLGIKPEYLEPETYRDGDENMIYRDIQLRAYTPDELRQAQKDSYLMNDDEKAIIKVMYEAD